MFELDKSSDSKNAFFNNLAKLFQEKKSLNGLEIISRTPAIKEGTFEAEIIECKFNNGLVLTIRCKYLKGNENNQEGGHRGAVEYESKVYEILQNELKLPLATFYGSFYLADINIYCLVVEYLEDCKRITKVQDKTVIFDAVRWIANFHAYYENANFENIKYYDNHYYTYWSNNARNIAGELSEEFSWINNVCDFYEGEIDILLSSNQTLIHGEFYPNNILYRDGLVYPVDWESAAIAAGEIDLASIMDGWGEDIERKMISVYIEVRWGKLDEQNRIEFYNRLKIAKLYWHLRWFGRYPNLFVWQKKPEKFKKFDRYLQRLFLFAKTNQILHTNTTLVDFKI